MESIKTPLVLISGFLGAGKTTFLRQLLPLLGQMGLRPHLVINDYGQAAIDAATLAELATSVRVINGSCVCCESQDEFLNLLALENLSHNSVLLIETNGTTDPYEIIECLGLDIRAQRYSSPLHVSIVDVQRWQKRWWHNELERLQIRSASYYYLSKADLVSPERLGNVEESLHLLSSFAEKATPSLVAHQLDILRKIVPTEEVPAAQPHSHQPHEDEDAHEDHEHESHEEHHSVAHGFVSLQLPLPNPISRDNMLAWLQALPPEVIRAKGFVRLTENSAHLFSFQKVEETHDITFLPLAAEFAREPLALLIGTGLSTMALLPPP